MSWIHDAAMRELEALGDGAAEKLGVEPGMITLWKTRALPFPLWIAEALLPEAKFHNPVALQPANWEGRKVCLLLPWYKSTHPVTAFSVMGLFERGKTACLMNAGDAFVAHVRNSLTRQFLDTGIEWALMIDDDMVVPWGNSSWFNRMSGLNLPDKFSGVHAINRLLSHGKNLVGALYYGRQRGGKPMYAEGFSNPGEFEMLLKHAPMDQVKTTAWVGTGCMLVNRQVFLDIELTFPHLARRPESRSTLDQNGHWFTSSEHELVLACNTALSLLAATEGSDTAKVATAERVLRESMIKSTRNSQLGMGEDVQFCIRAAQAGHQPHVDLGVMCGHLGSMSFPFK